MTSTPRPLRVAFLHDRLGIGGGERLVVDAALSLQARGHRVSLHVAHHPAASFSATRDGRLAVHVRGRRLPLHVAGRLRLPLAVARVVIAAGSALDPGEPLDALFCDSVAQVLPLLRRRTDAPLLFYGHYPDALTTPPRVGWYHWYRLPLDHWEAAGLKRADRLLVNSAFTAAAYRRRFPALRQTPTVLHPAVDLARFPAAAPPSACHTIVVISRLVRIKNLGLAIDALASLRGGLSSDAFAPLRLVIAGGYEPLLRECTETVDGLTARAAALGLAERVSIIRSPDDDALQALLAGARALLYTPGDEHFGYVPIEAMAAGRPVVAGDSGGPLETVVDGVTGFLRPPTAEPFADALRLLIEDPARADRMGAAGRAWVSERFSLAAFGEQLEAVIRSVRPRGSRAGAAGRAPCGR